MEIDFLPGGIESVQAGKCASLKKEQSGGREGGLRRWRSIQTGLGGR